MERTKHQMSNCSMARSLQVLGERWTLLIIREAFSGSTRFEQFHSVLGCPRNLLSERLRKLVDEAIFEPVDYQDSGARARKEYHLTDRGRALLPILLALREWGDSYKADPAGPPAINRHVGCGHKVHLAVICDAGHTVTDADMVEVVSGPGALVAERA
ncbi:hypothetical protein CH267_06860 [Rhodococcus sp. 06-621-2]|nr:helix-turn-helix domain-containing protein [Rhodococcus sp. 06-621-2]OZC59800.1 hypothetical protein CH267_06860 [Rhodococcus sp. 06-621-2]